MLLLRYQRQRQEEDGGGHRLPSGHETRRKINNHDRPGENRRAATRGTLICIFVCGSFLLTLGLSILFMGLMWGDIPSGDPTPFLVIGPTCIVLGILVLLLSVEIILKLRKISAASECADDDDDLPVKKGDDRQSWGGGTEGTPSKHPIPVIVHPATPLQPLDAASLPGNVPQR